MTMQPSQRKVINKPSVVLLHEKHGSRALDAKDDDALFKSMLTILKWRVEDGCFGEPLESDQPKPPGLTREEAQKLPEAIRRVAMVEIDRYTRALENWREDVDMHDRAMKALAENDGVMAFRIISRRKHFEYEGFEILEIES